MSDAMMLQTEALYPDFTQNYFQLFNLPEHYQLSIASLERAYLTLQRAVHPDRFVNDSKGQVLSVRYTALINEAYETLRSPLLRAQYLLKLSGLETDLGSTTIADKMFLMEQMELREALSEIRDASDPDAELEALMQTVNEKIADIQAQFVALWQQKTQEALAQASVLVQKMYFLYKFMDEARAEEERLLNL